MDVSPFFQIVGDYAVLRPVGQESLDQVAEMVRRSIELAKKERVTKLLAVGTRLDSLPAPSLSQRFFIFSDWAATSLGRVRLSMVARPWMIDPQKFGILVGRNRGLISDVFTSEEEALHWLMTYRYGSVVYPWEVPVKELPFW
jgi:hypothetical protein